ncbi:unnamed protein product [Pedinophyceae sp. YPF-701]|nr:unnamed protein product [Pedinophyceae sp. YPF-701]
MPRRTWGVREGKACDMLLSTPGPLGGTCILDSAAQHQSRLSATGHGNEELEWEGPGEPRALRMQRLFETSPGRQRTSVEQQAAERSAGAGGARDAAAPGARRSPSGGHSPAAQSSGVSGRRGTDRDASRRAPSGVSAGTREGSRIPDEFVTDAVASPRSRAARPAQQQPLPEKYTRFFAWYHQDHNRTGPPRIGALPGALLINHEARWTSPKQQRGRHTALAPATAAERVTNRHAEGFLPGATSPTGAFPPAPTWGAPSTAPAGLRRRNEAHARGLAALSTGYQTLVKGAKPVPPRAVCRMEVSHMMRNTRGGRARREMLDLTMDQIDDMLLGMRDGGPHGGAGGILSRESRMRAWEEARVYVDQAVEQIKVQKAREAQEAWMASHMEDLGRDVEDVVAEYEKDAQERAARKVTHVDLKDFVDEDVEDLRDLARPPPGAKITPFRAYAFEPREELDLAQRESQQAKLAAVQVKTYMRKLEASGQVGKAALWLNNRLNVGPRASMAIVREHLERQAREAPSRNRGVVASSLDAVDPVSTLPLHEQHLLRERSLVHHLRYPARSTLATAMASQQPLVSADLVKLVQNAEKRKLAVELGEEQGRGEARADRRMSMADQLKAQASRPDVSGRSVGVAGSKSTPNVA